VNLAVPIAQAGLGGGVAGGALAAAVARAGGLGTVGISPPKRFAADLREAVAEGGGGAVAAKLLVPFARRAHVEAIAAAGVRVAVLHGGFDRRLTAALHDAGAATVLHQVGTTAQAARALADGADGLIAQGLEAGGHVEGREPVRTLLPRVLDLAGGRPVLAAGGVASASDTAALLAAGATAVVAGTRFVLTHEANAHPGYQARLVAARETLRTQLFGFGWPAWHRVVPNAATDRWCARDEAGPAAVRALNRATAPLGRALPLAATGALTRRQRAWLPVLGPGPALPGDDAAILDAVPLYAGSGVARLDRVTGAAEAVAELTPR
jgi:NAD(P)H-dependent flavin oxidoreductase YrpB (nitropropane dioxygenase family)